MILIGIINGVIREFTYGKYLTELRTYQLFYQFLQHFYPGEG